MSPEWFAGFEKLPGFLINIVFAGLFLGTTQASLKKIWRLAAPQFCFGQIIAWGQYVVVLGLVFFLLAPVFNVPDVFGNLLEIDFEGSHGTVGGLTDTFHELSWPAGADLGYTVATFGMVLGIVIGMILVSIAVRCRFVKNNIRTFDNKSKAERIGFFLSDEQPSAVP